MANLKDVTLTGQESKTKITQSILNGKDTVEILGGDITITITGVPNTHVTKKVNDTKRK